SGGGWSWTSASSVGTRGEGGGSAAQEDRVGSCADGGPALSRPAQAARTARRSDVEVEQVGQSDRHHRSGRSGGEARAGLAGGGAGAALRQPARRGLGSRIPRHPRGDRAPGPGGRAGRLGPEEGGLPQERARRAAAVKSKGLRGPARREPFEGGASAGARRGR